MIKFIGGADAGILAQVAIDYSPRKRVDYE